MQPKFVPLGQDQDEPKQRWDRRPVSTSASQLGCYKCTNTYILKTYILDAYIGLHLILIDAVI
jgi:hypothetical protein